MLNLVLLCFMLSADFVVTRQGGSGFRDFACLTVGVVAPSHKAYDRILLVTLRVLSRCRA